MKQIELVYKSAEELGITEQERSELIEAIPYFLELDPGNFVMTNWNDCICGHIAKRNKRDPREEYMVISPALRSLYCLSGDVWNRIGYLDNWYAKPVDAARAIVAFLSA